MSIAIVGSCEIDNHCPLFYFVSLIYKIANFIFSFLTWRIDHVNTNGVQFAENPNRGYGDKCRFRGHMLLVTKWIHNGDEAVHCDHHQVDGRAEDNRQDLRYKKRAHRVVS